MPPWLWAKGIESECIPLTKPKRLQPLLTAVEEAADLD
jgi:hypothetical protein